MNKNMWFVGNGEWLIGNDAVQYVSDKVDESKKLMEQISMMAEEINHLNKNQILIDDGPITNVYEELYDLDERISLIEINCEMILEKIKEHKEND